MKGKELSKSWSKQFWKTLREGDIEKEVEDSGEFCAKVYRVLAGIDLSLEDAKNSVHVGTSPKLHSRYY